HCSRFSLRCLQKLFSLCRFETGDWNSSKSEISQVSVTTLIARCDFILSKFLTDENSLGVRSMPLVRENEVVFVLQELSGLVIHPETANYLPLRPHLKVGIVGPENAGRRTHLLALFPSLCELVVS
ncbi:hypothetical protein M569_03490, partial [Genlisea aurea]